MTSFRRRWRQAHTTLPPSSPLVAACTYRRTKQVPHHQRIDVLRLLLDETELDFTVSDSQAWKMVLVLLERSRPSSGFTSSDAAATWVLNACQEELRRHFQPAYAFWLLLFCCESAAAMQVLLRIHPAIVHATADGLDGFNIIHAKIAEGFPEAVFLAFRLLARCGVDLHRTSTTQSYGAPAPPAPPCCDTPTSLALRRSSNFALWRALLRDLGCDPAALAAALGDDMPFVPFLVPPSLCWQCQREVYRVYDLDEGWWEAALADFRRWDGLQGSRPVSRSSLASSGPWSSDAEFFDASETQAAVVAGVKEATARTLPPSASLCWKCDMMQVVRGEGDAGGERVVGGKERVP